MFMIITGEVRIIQGSEMQDAIIEFAKEKNLKDVLPKDQKCSKYSK